MQVLSAPLGLEGTGGRRPAGAACRILSQWFLSRGQKSIFFVVGSVHEQASASGGVGVRRAGAPRSAGKEVSQRMFPLGLPVLLTLAVHCGTVNKLVN